MDIIGLKNPNLKELKSILQGSLEDRYLVAVEGIGNIEKLVNTDSIVCKVFVCFDNIRSDLERTIINSCITKSKESYQVTDKTMAAISSKERKECIIAVAKLKKLELKGNSNKLIILDSLENPGNVGTIFRSADGSGVDGVIIVNEVTRVNSQRVVNASMGGIFSVPYMICNDLKILVQTLKDEGVGIVAASPHANLYYYDFTGDYPLALLLGNERYGYNKDWTSYVDYEIKIPMKGNCDSLNVGVAASILSYHLFGRA